MKLRFAGLIMIFGLFVFAGCNNQESATTHEASAKEKLVVQAEEETKVPTKEDKIALAKCLNENGVKLYTASWCGHCKKQKEAFGEGLAYLNNTECAEGDGWAQACTDAGVKAVPTWIYADGTVKTGNTPLATLAKANGCTYNF